MGICSSKTLGDSFSSIPRDFWMNKATDIESNTVTISEYRGKKVFLVVNLPTNSTFLNYYKKYARFLDSIKDDRVIVLGFFSQINPSIRSEEVYMSPSIIRSTSNFVLFSRVNVNGQHTHPIYRFLRANSPMYNADKKVCRRISSYNWIFLLDKDGNVVRLYKPGTSLSKLQNDIQNLLLLT